MIIFLFSYNEIGGVATLFSNIAEYFDKTKTPLCLICNEHSAIHSMFGEKKMNFTFINYDTLTRQIISNVFSNLDTLIITAWDLKLDLFNKVNPKIIFWNVYPTTLYYSNIVSRNKILHWMNKSLIRKMQNERGLFFMDDSPSEWMQKYNLEHISERHLLQIPIHPIDYMYKTEYTKDKNLKITYIGRAEKWKLFPLVKIIEDMNNINHNFTLSIITDDILKTKKFLQLNVAETINENIVYQYSENIPNSAIAKHLLENSDINIGMGTTCLESAKVGIPTLIIDPSHIHIGNNYKYIWLYETKRYNLGKFYDTTNIYNGEYLADIIANCNSDQSYLTTISQDCFSYVNTHHNINLVGQKLNINILNSNLFVKEVTKKIYKYSMLSKIINIFKSSINYSKDSLKY